MGFVATIVRKSSGRGVTFLKLYFGLSDGIIVVVGVFEGQFSGYFDGVVIAFHLIVGFHPNVLHLFSLSFGFLPVVECGEQ